MTTGRNLELALRIQADMAEAVHALDRVEQGVEDIGEAGRRAGAALKGIDASALESTGRAAERGAAGVKRQAESADQAAARIRAMVQASLEHQRALQAQISTEAQAAEATRQSTLQSQQQAEALRAANRAAFEQQAAVTAQIRAIGELQERLDAGAASFEQLAETEQMLDRAMSAGLVTAEEYADALDALDKQEAQLTRAHAAENREMERLLTRYDEATGKLAQLARDEQRLTQAVDAGRISRERYNRAMVSIQAQRAQWQAVVDGADQAAASISRVGANTARLNQSIATVLRNLATGNTSAAGGALTTLGFRGAAGLSGTLLTLGGITAALGVFAVAAAKSYREGRELDRVLTLTGDAAGVTAGAVTDMARDIDRATGQVGKGRQALLSLVEAGMTASEGLADAGRAAVALSELTGRSIQDTTALMQRLAREPSRQAAELNRQYRFLTIEIYQQVRALEEQGRAQDAANLIMQRFADEQERNLKRVNEQLTAMERLWRRIKAEASEGFQSIGRAALVTLGEATLDDELTLLRTQIENQLQPLRAGGLADNLAEALASPRVSRGLKDRLRQLQEQESVLAAVVEAERDLAGIRERQQKAVESGIDAEQALRQQLDRLDRERAKKQEILELEQRLAKARESGVTQVGGVSIDDVERQARADIERRYAERVDGTVAARDAVRRELQQLERDLQDNLVSLNDYYAQREALQLRDIALREQAARQDLALAATAGERQRIEAQLTILERERADVAADSIRDRLQAERDLNDELERIRAQWLQATGRAGEATLANLQLQYRDTLARMQIEGNDAGVKLVDRLINVELAKVRLQELQRDVERVQAEISRGEQTIQAQVQVGLISETTARRELLALRQREIAQIGELIPLLEQAANQAGDEQALARIEDLAHRLRLLQYEANELQLAFQRGFESGLANALERLATGTASLREAAVGLIQDITRSMAQLAAQQMAAMATEALMRRIRSASGNKSPDLANPDPAQAAAAGAAYALPIGGAAKALAGSAIPLEAAARSLSAAAMQLAAANASGSGGGGGSGSGNSWAQWAQLAMSFFGGGYADGGHVRGPGTSTSDSINARLSDYEFVTRAAVVRQPGALEFLEDFNRRGMAALRGWTAHAPAIYARPSPRHHFADGGLARGGQSPAPQVNLTNAVVFDMEDLIHRMAAHPAAEKMIVTHAIANGDTIRSGWE